jgi:plasmid stabilization system protein ParE
MTREIKFSFNAEKSYNKISAYLQRDFSTKLVDDFNSKVDFALKAILQHPESFLKSELRKNYYKCVIAK